MGIAHCGLRGGGWGLCAEDWEEGKMGIVHGVENDENIRRVWGII